jgi:SAM-dependent methyltransferase
LNKIVKRIEGSKAHGIGYREWRRRRLFIAAEIVGPGTFIDLGCANGFLLRCLLKWSGQALVPYGIDIDGNAVAGCRELFPRHDGHFARMDVRDFAVRTPAGFPGRYDYVFWNMPNGWTVEEKARLARRLTARVAPGGRLLLAVYGGNAAGLDASQRAAERRGVLEVFARLEALGIGFAHVRPNPLGTSHCVGRVAAGQVVDAPGDRV